MLFSNNVIPKAEEASWMDSSPAFSLPDLIEKYTPKTFQVEVKTKDTVLP